MIKPVAKSVGMTLIYAADSHIDVETFIDFFGSYLRFKYDSDGKNIVDFLKSYMFVLHLIPNRIRAFHTGFNLIFDAHMVESFADWSRKLCEKFVAFLLSEC